MQRKCVRSEGVQATQQRTGWSIGRNEGKGKWRAPGGTTPNAQMRAGQEAAQQGTRRPGACMSPIVAHLQSQRNNNHLPKEQESKRTKGSRHPHNKTRQWNARRASTRYPRTHQSKQPQPAQARELRKAARQADDGSNTGGQGRDKVRAHKGGRPQRGKRDRVKSCKRDA